MRLKIIIFITFSILSFFCFGAEKVQELMNNPADLSQKINVLESLIAKEIESTQRQELEVLKWGLVDIKNNLLNLKNDKAIVEAIDYAKNKGWTNTLRELHNLKATCSISNKMGNECFVEKSEFDLFIDSRNISNVEKMKFKSFLEEYITYIQAKLIINENLLKSVNQSLLKFESLINKSLRPLASIKLSTPTLTNIKKISTEKKAVVVVQKNESYFFNQMFSVKNLVGISVMSLAFVLISFFGRKFYLRRIKQKEVNNFYKTIFYQSHKNKTKTKIFGSIDLSDFKKFNHIKKSYVQFIELLGPFKSSMDIKFKKKDKTFIIETLLYTSIPMQQYFNSENHGPFFQGVSKLNELASQIAGKVFITNSFDQTGNIVSSKLIISL